LTNRPPDDLRGTAKFASFLSGLDRESYLWRIIENGLDVLRANMLAGEKVERRKWPREYVRQYGIRNLFRFDLDRNHRLTYTIVAEEMRKVVCVIEVMDHRTYNQRFGYS